MRAATFGLLPLLLGLGGCGSGAPAVAGAAAERMALPNAGEGAIIDQAQVLSSTERTRLAARAGAISRGGRPVTVVVLRQQAGTSLEQIGWAVNRPGSSGRQLLMLVDPEQQSVRVEGAGVTPAQAAAVAGAMQPALGQRQLMTAIEAGLAATAGLAGTPRA